MEQHQGSRCKTKKLKENKMHSQYAAAFYLHYYFLPPTLLFAVLFLISAKISAKNLILNRFGRKWIYCTEKRGFRKNWRLYS